MKKLTAIVLIAIMLFSLCACTVENVGPDLNTQGQQSSEVEKDYAFPVNGVEIIAHAPAAPIVDALGEPNEILEIPSCATDDTDKFYRYQSYELCTYPANGEYFVYSLTLLNDTVTTAEGVAIGDSLDKMTEAYGSDYEADGVICVYTRGRTQLKFTVENEKITGISYVAVID